MTHVKDGRHAGQNVNKCCIERCIVAPPPSHCCTDSEQDGGDGIGTFSVCTVGGSGHAAAIFVEVSGLVYLVPPHQSVRSKVEAESGGFSVNISEEKQHAQV